MKATIATLAAILAAGTAGAQNLYNGFEEGNHDLYSGQSGEHRVSAMPPGIGSGFDRYRGWARDNPDLFGRTPVSGSGAGGTVNVYGGFAGNPDL